MRTEQDSRYLEYEQRLWMQWSATGKCFRAYGHFPLGSLQLQAALVSQENPEMLKAMSLAGCLQISNLATLSTLAILTAPGLPELISTNRKRLAESYHIMTTFLEQRGLEYVPATAGLYVFTRLLPASEVCVSESRLALLLKDSGILVGTGQAYHAGSNARGWFRLVFSMRPAHLRNALVQLGTALDSAMAGESESLLGNRMFK